MMKRILLLIVVLIAPTLVQADTYSCSGGAASPSAYCATFGGGTATNGRNTWSNYYSYNCVSADGTPQNHLSVQCQITCDDGGVPDETGQCGGAGGGDDDGGDEQSCDTKTGDAAGGFTFDESQGAQYNQVCISGCSAGPAGLTVCVGGTCSGQYEYNGASCEGMGDGSGRHENADTDPPPANVPDGGDPCEGGFYGEVNGEVGCFGSSSGSGDSGSGSSGGDDSGGSTGGDSGTGGGGDIVGGGDDSGGSDGSGSGGGDSGSGSGGGGGGDTGGDGGSTTGGDSGGGGGEGDGSGGGGGASACADTDSDGIVDGTSDTVSSCMQQSCAAGQTYGEVNGVTGCHGSTTGTAAICQDSDSDGFDDSTNVDMDTCLNQGQGLTDLTATNDILNGIADSMPSGISSTEETPTNTKETGKAALSAAWSRMGDSPIISATENIFASFPSGGGTCPSLTIFVFNSTINSTMHCSLFDDVKDLLSPIMLAFWSIVAVMIFRRA